MDVGKSSLGNCYYMPVCHCPGQAYKSKWPFGFTCCGHSPRYSRTYHGYVCVCMWIAGWTFTVEYITMGTLTTSLHNPFSDSFS